MSWLKTKSPDLFDNDLVMLALPADSEDPDATDYVPATWDSHTKVFIAMIDYHNGDCFSIDAIKGYFPIHRFGEFPRTPLPE